MLARMFSGLLENARDSSGRVFIDRDGSQFSIVMQYLRDGQHFRLPESLGDDQLHALEREAHSTQCFSVNRLIQLQTLVSVTSACTRCEPQCFS
jgi:BTB/POZ domain